MNRNYVIATWLGGRRHEDPVYQRDPFAYIRAHLFTLTKLEHNLDQVTVVINRDIEGHWRYAAHFLSGFCRELPIKFLIRDNIGMSYGAFSAAARLYQAKWTIFMQDDWVFSQKLFDRKLLRLYNNVGGDKFLSFDDRTMRFAPVPNGFIGRDLLLEILEKNDGDLYFKREPDPSQVYAAGYQSRRYFPHPDVERLPVLDHYKIGYIDKKAERWEDGLHLSFEGKGHTLVVPIQVLTSPMSVFVARSERHLIRAIRERFQYGEKKATA